MSKKFVVLALMLLTLVIISGGCGGGSSSSKNSDGIVLEEALEVGAEVSVKVIWNSEEYVVNFRNIGNGDFETVGLADDDLPFDCMMSYGTEGVSALFEDKEYDDIYFSFYVNVYTSKYKILLSRVLEQMWSRSDGISSFVVNGVDFIEELDYDFEEEDWPDVEPYDTLKDVVKENGVLTLEFTMNGKTYHYTWRSDGINFNIIDNFSENVLSKVEASISDDGFDAIFVDDNTGTWLIYVFNTETSTYQVITNGTDVKLDKIYVNGFDFTNTVSETTSQVDGILAPALLKGAEIQLQITWNGQVRSINFVNIGNGEFRSNQSNNTAELSISGRYLIGSIDENEEFMTVSFSLVDDTYWSYSSKAGNTFNLISLNQIGITDELTEVNSSN